MLKPDLYLYYHRKSMEKKSVSSLHNMIKEDLKFNYGFIRRHLYQFIWKKILSRKNLPLVVSSFEMLKYYEDFLQRKSLITIIPYGITKKQIKEIGLEDRDKITKLKQKYTLIGSVGLVIKRKGFEQLVYFLQKNKNYAVVIIGDGSEKESLLNLSESLNVSDRFIILGFKNDSYNYYKYFDIYTLVSYSEGFGLAMLEAMAYGLPIVCTDLPIYKGYFNNTQVGLFESGNIESLSKAIHLVSDHKSEYSDASKKLFENEFSSSVMGEKHFEFYNKLKNDKTNR